MSVVNDLGYGFCPECKQWKQLTHRHPRDRKLPLRQREKICGNCAHKYKTTNIPFHKIKKTVSSHKTNTGECDFDKKDLMLIHSWQGGKCAYCRDPIPYDFTLEHIVPRKFEGRNLKFNILLICGECNSSKQHKEITWWLDKQNIKLDERIFQKVRDAYDQHGYEFKGTCRNCLGITRQTNKPFCGSKCSPVDWQTIHTDYATAQAVRSKSTRGKSR